MNNDPETFPSIHSFAWDSDRANRPPFFIIIAQAYAVRMDSSETCLNCGKQLTSGRCLNCGNCERCGA